MDQPKGVNPAFGQPTAPKWTRSDKDGIGTAMSSASTLWFTIAKGAVTEVYYPTIDLPQIRDLQYLATDGATFFHDERRGFDNVHELLSPNALGYRITNNSHPTPGGQTYQIIKQVISAPSSPCLLVQTKLNVPAPLRQELKLYALLAPHMDGSGNHNSCWVASTPFGKILVAQSNQQGGTWLAMAATVPFLQCSCGIVGVTDGWQDLNGGSVPGNQPFIMDWTFDSAINSNVALTGQLDISSTDEFVLGLAFGETMNSAVQRVRQALSLPFQLGPADPPSQYNHLGEFLAGWDKAQSGIVAPRAGVTGDGDKLYRMSRGVLMAHEDKIYDGALIASLSIPWGEYSDDADFGYHLVWTRDMCNSASALLASGNKDTPLRALIFLATVQREDGAFYQNFRVDGTAYRTNIQLDEIAFPIMLAWRVDNAGALQNFDPYPMVRRAAAALILNGPMTQQERWEENEGYSPSTLAATIAAMICAASFATKRGDAALAGFFNDYADFLESHLEQWTVAGDCQFLPNVRHYIRILPTSVKGDPGRVGPLNVPAAPATDGDPNQASVMIGNRYGLQIAAKNLLDPGFLELVRYGIRAANDPLMVDSLRAVDSAGANIKVDFTNPASRSGSDWHRYNEDGYGNYADGRPFDGSGRGGTWPLLAGERGHYELAAGHDPLPYIRAMEKFADGPGLISEQLWDLPDLPTAHMKLSYPSGAAMPLAWAHAEYIKLVRSATDKSVYDLIPDVANRYLAAHPRSTLEIWNFYRQIDAIDRSATLRIVLPWAFELHWSADGWIHTNDTRATSPITGLFFADVPPLRRSGSLIFTFFWTELQQWQQLNYAVNVH
ncbi:MAG TPA: glycoside hydrolase family 15 protein [Tepidisphaeraceae bacterium]|nr:glycoside hydrolase family 15 protein [Tepidisphaeraceae bacterium]